MPQFIFVDHSIRTIGGHEYDYACHVLSAAHSAGFDISIGVNRRFSIQNAFPENCRIHPVFLNDAYCEFTDLEGIRCLIEDKRDQRAAKYPRLISAPKRLLNSCANQFEQRALPVRRIVRNKWIVQFARDCADLFHEIQLDKGDHVFLATISDIDLLGLAQFLRTEPSTKLAQWHLQFHFNLFEGRDPEYESQKRRHELVRQHFRHALQQVPQHSLHFYNTTEALARQYNRLGVGRFSELTYPISENFQQCSRSCESKRKRLRGVCAGGVRKEKGHAQFSELLENLWSDFFAKERIQLVIQSRMARRTGKPRIAALQFKNKSIVPDRFRNPDDSEDEPLVLVRHPLPQNEYVKLIQGADVGLFLYNSRRYHTRRAGVLGEYLSAGIPVIVPAGCWLAEQIAEPIFQHVERQRERLPIVGCITQKQINWNLPVVSGETPRPCPHSVALSRKWPASASFMIPEPASELIVGFKWTDPKTPGSYVRINCEQADAEGNLVASVTSILGHRQKEEKCSTLIHLAPNSSSLRLTLSNAYDDAELLLSDVQATFHQADEPCPAGAVGLIAADADQIPVLLEDMLKNYQDYRESARRFRNDWSAKHDPHGTFRQLIFAADARGEAA